MDAVITKPHVVAVTKQDDARPRRIREQAREFSSVLDSDGAT